MKGRKLSTIQSGMSFANKALRPNTRLHNRPNPYGKVVSSQKRERKEIRLPTLYLTEEYALVRRDSEDCLLVQIPEKKGKDGSVVSEAYKKRIPLHKVDDVVVMGEITMTASAIYLLMEKNIEIHFLNYYGQFKGCLSPPLAKNSLLRMAQHRVHNDLPRRCELARRFVIGKLSNQTNYAATL